MEYGENPEWVNVTQGRRQRCALSPVASNVSFAAATYVVLVVCLSRDELIIVRDLVHLQEVGVFGKKEPLACVRRAVWGIFYADDA